MKAHAIRCASEACGQVTLNVKFLKSTIGARGHTENDLLFTWNLLPSSTTKPQPSYIPAPLISDYQEACAIKNLSPKASATLARRCIQGMIRDFCGIQKNNLAEAINQLRQMTDTQSAPAGVTPDLVGAIDAIRQIGNIGAHMEKDINLIVDVEPNEAQMLIGLIEMLFSEWYVARHMREERVKAVIALAASKEAERKRPQILQTDGDSQKSNALPLGRGIIKPATP